MSAWLPPWHRDIGLWVHVALSGIMLAHVGSLRPHLLNVRTRDDGE